MFRLHVVTRLWSGAERSHTLLVQCPTQKEATRHGLDAADNLGGAFVRLVVEVVS